MKEKILPILIVVMAGLVLVNLVILDIDWVRARKKQKTSLPLANIHQEASPVSPSPSREAPPDSTLPPVFSPTILPMTTPIDSCGSICQETIAQKVAEAMATVSGKETIKETTVVKETTQQISQPQIVYIPLGGGGSTTSREWADVSSAEVYLDIDEYSNIDKIYFEGFIKVKHGNGKVFAQLYDATHKVGVQGSKIESGSENYSLVQSDPLSLWQGKNLYRVQVMSLNGYEAFFDSGRIKIIIK